MERNVQERQTREIRQVNRTPKETGARADKPLRETRSRPAESASSALREKAWRVTSACDRSDPVCRAYVRRVRH